MRIHLTALFLLVAGSLVHGHDEVTPKPKLIQKGVPQRRLSAEEGDGRVFSFVVPPGARELVVKTRYGVGDADIYLRRGAHPTVFRYDFPRPEDGRIAGNRETIRVESPEPGPWYVLVDAFKGFRGVSLVATYRMARGSLPVPKFLPGPGIYAGKALLHLGARARGTALRYTLDGSEPTIESTVYTKPFFLTTDSQVRVKPFHRDGTAGPEASGWFFVVPEDEVTTLTNAQALHHRAGAKGSSHVFKITVPPGQSSLQVRVEGRAGIADVFLKQGAAPTPQSFTYRGRRNGKNSSIDVPNPAPGEWFIQLRGRTAFAGYSILSLVRPDDADLIVWQPELDPYVMTQTFEAGMDCEVDEGLITAGTHRLLRFSTETRNIGKSPLIVPTQGQSPELFEFQECHGHYHFLGFASYRLLDGNGEEVATGRKVSFCLEDVRRWDPSSNPSPVYDCGDQGIQAGWSDVYESGLPGQWIDITGIPAGNYTLEITMNPEQHLLEADYTNNTATMQVEIPEE